MVEIAKVAPMGKKYRVVGPDDKPLMTNDQEPIDGGGYARENFARLRAGEINDYYANHPAAKQAKVEKS